MLKVYLFKNQEMKYHSNVEKNKYWDTSAHVWCYGCDLCKILTAMQKWWFDTLSINNATPFWTWLDYWEEYDTFIVFVKDIDKRYNKLNLTRYELEDLKKGFSYLDNKNGCDWVKGKSEGDKQIPKNNNETIYSWPRWI